MRTPVVVRRSNTDNCISTDDSSNFKGSSIKHSIDKSFSEQRVSNEFKKSNSQQFKRFSCNTPYLNKNDMKSKNKVNISLDSIPYTGPINNLKNRNSASAHKKNVKIERKLVSFIDLKLKI